jgi:fatty-acyl-CoA synthase
MKAPLSRTLYDLLYEQVGRGPEREAIVLGEQRVSYGAWLDASRRVAARLRDLGVRRGQRVGLLANNRVEWLEICFGAAALGAPLAAFNTWAKTWDLEYLLAHSRCEVLFTLDRLGNQDFLAYLRELIPELWDGPHGAWRSARFPHLREVIVIGDEAPPGAHRYDEWQRIDASALPDLAPGECASPPDVAYILYTSGSTARPKAVPLLHYAAIENGFNIGERQGLGPDDRVWVSVPLFWSLGSANALMAILTHRATLVLQSQFEPRAALALIEAERCTSVYTLPNITHALIEHPEFRPERTRSLRTGMTIGLPEDVRLAAEVLGAREVCNIYGSTETYGNCCVTPHDLPLETRLTSQGPPLPGVTMRIVDRQSNAPLPSGEVGAVEVKGYITPGYLEAPEENVASFTDDGFFRMGDMGWLDEHGCFHFFAREKEMIKTGGINVSPLEVEEFLVTHPAVQEVAVTGAPDPTRGEVVVAFARLRPGAMATPDELRQYCRDHIASYKAPALVVVSETFPKTDTGKLARRELKQWAQDAIKQLETRR